MRKVIAYREREARAKEAARQAREEAHWALEEAHWARAEANWTRSHRTSRFMLKCAVVTLACMLSTNNHVERGVSYVSNAGWRPTGPSPNAVASANTNNPQSEAASSETTSVSNTSAQRHDQSANPVLQFAGQPPPDTAVSAFSPPPGLDSGGLLHLNGEAFPNASLTAASAIESSGLIHLASATFPNTSLTSPSVIDSSGLLHLNGEVFPNTSLTSPSVIGSSGLVHLPQ